MPLWVYPKCHAVLTLHPPRYKGVLVVVLYPSTHLHYVVHMKVHVHVHVQCTCTCTVYMYMCTYTMMELGGSLKTGLKENKFR